MSKDLGIQNKKEENFSEWYTEIVQKAELADYTKVSGCIVFMPRSYEIWEVIQGFLDKKFKRSGVKNAYFPLFIPESLLTKEKDHVEGFTPEVAWVTHSGDTKLNERLAVRPTSETIMYDSYSQWIRSHRDLPLRLNQWCSVVRWEFSHPVPFLRTREFLWQEGHTVFATKEEADKEVLEMLDYYSEAYEDVLAIPVIKGIKSEKEKFAGALYTTTLEIILPNGKAIQGCTSHQLGQNFAKAFNITFTNDQEKNQFAWQNSWGFSTRSIGIMIMMHSDNKGLVIPPKAASLHAVIVPILVGNNKEEVLKKCKELKKHLKHIEVILDDRDYTPGWKYNDWEMKGVPLRIEIGPKDVEKNQIVLVRRDTGKKEFVSFDKADERSKELLEEIQKDLFDKAKKLLEESIVLAHSEKELLSAVENKKIAKINWCNTRDCEDAIKEKTGAKSLCMPFDESAVKHGTKCAICSKDAKVVILFGRSY